MDLENVNAICHADAPYLGARLAARMPTGILSPESELEGGYHGVHLCVNSGDDEPIMLIGSVTIDCYNPTKYPSGALAVESLGEAIGPNQAGDFIAHRGEVYFYELSMSEYYGPGGVPQPQETPALQPEMRAVASESMKAVEDDPTEEETAKEEDTAKSVDLASIPTELLAMMFKGLDDQWQSGLITSEMPAAKMREHGRAIYEEIQKRTPHIKMDSPLLVDTPEPAEAPVRKCRIAKVSKAEEPEYMYVLSIVMEPNDGQDGAPANPDFDDEIYDRHAIRKLAYPYVSKFRQLGLMHEGEPLGPDDARMVQSYVVDDGFKLTTDQGRVLKQGTWLLGTEVKRSCVVGKGIENGEIGAFSIQGLALKVPEKLAA